MSISTEKSIINDKVDLQISNVNAKIDKVNKDQSDSLVAAKTELNTAISTA